MSDTRTMQAQLEDQRRKVDVDSYTITVREILSMAERRELHRAPEYQRKFRWDPESESRLIESILLGLPIPNIFVATNDDGSWEVVDGLQRVSTLIHFASESDAELDEIGKLEPLKLTGLRKLESFNDLQFRDLPIPLQLSFSKRGIGVTALSDKSDPETRFDTFERLNRGALALSPQEIRACIYEGGLNSLLRELAADASFKMLVKLQDADERNATREELVLKFFAYLNDRPSFKGGVETFLTNYMEENQKTFDVASGRREFFQVVEHLVRIGPTPFLRNTTNVTPKNELEAVMVAVAEINREGKKFGTPRQNWADDSVLVAASTGATNTAKKLRERIDRARVLLGE